MRELTDNEKRYIKMEVGKNNRPALLIAAMLRCDVELVKAYIREENIVPTNQNKDAGRIVVKT